jgi:protein-tyrosine-phosphatase
MKRILFVCIENAGRSQMAEGFAKKYGGGDFVVFREGNKPAGKINPVVVEVMKEKSIDLSANKPKLITAKMAMDADLIVTLGCNHQGICPGHSLNLQLIGHWKIQRMSLLKRLEKYGMKSNGV